MNISSSTGYAGASNPGYNASASQDSVNKPSGSLPKTDHDVKTTALPTSEKSLQEQQLEETKQYKKEDQQKELKKQEADQFFEKQQKKQEEINKMAYEMLANQGIAQIGIDNQLALNKDNYEDTVKHLVAKGFQIETDEQKLTISSQLHQLKLEISKESYNQYVKTVYGKEIAEAYTDIEDSPAPVYPENSVAETKATSTPSEPSHSSPSPTTQTEHSTSQSTSSTTTNSTVTPDPVSSSDPTPVTNNNNSSTTGTTNSSNNSHSSTSANGSSGSHTTSSGPSSSTNNGNTIGAILPGGLVK
ncbi:hypothetical protein PO903_10635 [Paenibacillus sp. PK4536]|uniref:hypothetical protein n=1 Tax=Paenibacillus sp. PK4536 TaxID=3024576 RepID=UPI002359B5D8|nr:hypothetical protein [Paenibacillus sp. PK4536]WIM41297.1 hypothetical protein PO903_10635 [Paenibacillus sp. PK4536]